MNTQTLYDLLAGGADASQLIDDFLKQLDEAQNRILKEEAEKRITDEKLKTELISQIEDLGEKAEYITQLLSDYTKEDEDREKILRRITEAIEPLVEATESIYIGDILNFMNELGSKL